MHGTMETLFREIQLFERKNVLAEIQFVKYFADTFKLNPYQLLNCKKITSLSIILVYSTF